MPHQPDLGWEHARAIRDHWRGKLILKGLLHPDDAVMSRDPGADGVVLSSHGMRNFDSTIAPVDALPAIRRAVGPDFTLLAAEGLRGAEPMIALLASELADAQRFVPLNAKRSDFAQSVR